MVTQGPTKQAIIAAGRAEMAEWLRAAESHGTIYYAVTHVARSGMSRRIELATIVYAETMEPRSIVTTATLKHAWPRPPVHLPPDHSYLDTVARDLGFSWRHRCFVVNGGGMDMVFALVDDLADRCLPGDEGRGYANRVRRESMLRGYSAEAAGY